MLRLRVESSAGTWISFRRTTYLLLALIAPIGVAGAISTGARFGSVLLAALGLSYGISVFGVEFTIHAARKPTEFHFDPEGLRVRGPGTVSRALRWQDLSSVALRTGGPHRAPSVVLFRFRAGLRVALLALSLDDHRDVAERIAGFVAHYAPLVRRTGRTRVLGWDPGRAVDGEMSIVGPGFTPLFYAATALVGIAWGVYATSMAFGVGIVRDQGLGLAMVGSYLVLGAVLLLHARRSIARSAVARGPAPPDRLAQASLVAAAGFLVLEGLLGVRFWLR